VDRTVIGAGELTRPDTQLNKTILLIEIAVRPDAAAWCRARMLAADEEASQRNCNMGAEITPSEERVLRAICASCGPLGVAALGLSRALGVTRNTVSTTAVNLERKGYCTRERVGMRIFLRPTAAGLAMAARAEQRAEESSPSPAMEPDSDDAPSHILESAEDFSAPAPTLLDSQARILDAAARSGGPVATSRLVELTGLTDRAVHRQATRLYAKGYLARIREERRWLWTLTNKGRAHLQGRLSLRSASAFEPMRRVR
jgi:DNA-binding MarR family transcriptional regulator